MGLLARSKTKISILALLSMVVLLAFLFSAPARFWTIVAGPSDMGTIDFSALVKSEKPNEYLLCPKAICPHAAIDETSKNYPVSVPELKKAFLSSLPTENIEKILDEPTRLRFVVRTPLMQFPDTVSIGFFAGADGGSQIAIYSRSQIGYSDLGTNKKRVKAWVATMEAAL